MHGDDTDSTESPPVVGEGGESGDILAGKSVVFASLEVILVVFVQYIPALNPKSGSSPPGSSPPATDLTVTEDMSALISSALQCIPMLPTLCSPAGTWGGGGGGMHMPLTLIYFDNSTVNQTINVSEMQKLSMLNVMETI